MTEKTTLSFSARNSLARLTLVIRSWSPIFGRSAEFFVLAVVRVAFVLPLLLLVLELAEVHDAANGRLLLRGDFDQVEPDFAGLLQGLDGFDDAQLGAVVSDDADRRDADLLVDPLTFLRSMAWSLLWG